MEKSYGVAVLVFIFILGTQGLTLWLLVGPVGALLVAELVRGVVSDGWQG